jgi:hypothetical protein
MTPSDGYYYDDERHLHQSKQGDDAYWDESARRQRLNGMTPEQRKNNPNAEPMGHFTGRCKRCGSNDLWDDNAHYGCKTCGAFLL